MDYWISVKEGQVVPRYFKLCQAGRFDEVELDTCCSGLLRFVEIC